MFKIVIKGIDKSVRTLRNVTDFTMDDEYLIMNVDSVWHDFIQVKVHSTEIHNIKVEREESRGK